MSTNSLRNVIPQRTHRERSQPAHRQKKYGLLEKHSDYKQRAVDYHKKSDIIKRLQLKASLRNPDEFYFGMQNTRTQHGVHTIQRYGNQYSNIENKLMKIQDINYLTYQMQHNKHRVDKLNSNLQMLTERKPPHTNDHNNQLEPKHVVFVDNNDEQQSFTASEYFDTPSSLLSRRYNRPRTSQINGASSIILNKQSNNDTINYHTIKQLNTQRLHEYKNINSRLQHNNKINNTLQYLIVQKNLLQKGRRKKIVTVDKFGDVDEKKTIFQWKLQRKK